MPDAPPDRASIDALLRDFRARLAGEQRQRWPISPRALEPSWDVRYAIGAPTAAGSIILQRDPDRVAILFCGRGLGGYTVLPVQPTSSTDGINIVSAGLPYEVSLHTHGGLVTVEWWGRSIAGASVAGIITVCYLPDRASRRPVKKGDDGVPAT